MERDEKLKALDAALVQIEKQYGKGAVMKLGDPTAQMNVETIPTGSLSLDVALGLGGIPKGRIVEIYGPESSGKTTVTLHMVAEVQKRGGIAGFIDAEHALDPVYAKNIGVDIDNLYISQPDSGEQALEITETMVRSGAVDIIVVDSVAALVPKAEIEGDMGDSHVGLQARLMSQALRKLTAVISKSNCTVVFINQLREKVGVMFGNPETTTGGRALKFYSSVRLDVRRIETLKQGGEMIGNRTRVKVVKNKIAPPFKEAEFDIMFGEGISVAGDILDLAAQVNIINKSGAWYAYEGNKIGQGRENAKQYLKDNPAVCAEIEGKVREHFGLQQDKKPAENTESASGAKKTEKKGMTVTELSEVSASKVKVYVEEEFAFVLYKGELRKYGIKEAGELKPEIYTEIMKEVLPKRAKLRCMNLLKSRDYTRAQLHDKLKQGFYPEAVIEEALDYVASFHYIDDFRYAEDFINCSASGKSRRRIENDLHKKGIDQDTIERAWRKWEEAGNEQDEEEQIERLLVKKHFDAETADRKEMERIMSFLMRKGFSFDKIRSVMQKKLALS